MPVTTEGDQTAQAEAPAEQPSSITFFHFGPNKLVVSLSQFALKLETYFRMAEIPYQEEMSLKTSSKGKVPFIKDGVKEVPDTNFIIPYLNEKFSKDLDASLSCQEKAISLAFKRMVEENLYWATLYHRWIENWQSFSKQLPVTGMRKKLLPIAGAIWLKPNAKSNLHAHGMGRHSAEEIKQIAEKDLRALSAYLGDKQFFMGDEPTEIDACIFGCLAQLVYASPGSWYEKLLKEDLKNLAELTNRMKEKYFPDWDQKLLQEKKKEEEPADSKKEKESQEKEAENGSNKDAAAENPKEENTAEGGGGEAAGDAEESGGEQVAESKEEENKDADKPKVEEGNGESKNGDGAEQKVE